MTLVQTIEGANREVATVEPVAQASALAAAVLAGSAMDARPWRSLAYTITVITNTITWWVYGANASNYSDEVIVSGPTDVVAGATSSYAVAQAPYAYYRAYIQTKVNPNHGTVTLHGICKF